MKWNFFREMGRKTIHLLIIVVLIGYSLLRNIFSEKIALMALVMLLLIFIIFEYFRLDLNIRIKWFDFFIRPKEINKMYSAIYFLSSTVICFAVFEYRIAIAALLMTTFGDMVAAVVGQRFGHKLIFKKKTLTGSVAEFGVNLITGFVVLFSVVNIYAIIIMAFTATVVEAIVDNIDDNLAVPLFTGFIGQILFLLA